MTQVVVALLVVVVIHNHYFKSVPIIYSVLCMYQVLFIIIIWLILTTLEIRITQAFKFMGVKEGLTQLEKESSFYSKIRKMDRFSKSQFFYFPNIITSCCFAHLRSTKTQTWVFYCHWALSLTQTDGWAIAFSPKINFSLS